MLLSAFPNLTVSDLELALRQSAFDLGVTGAGNTYGYGQADLAAAFQFLLSNSGAHISVSPSSQSFSDVQVGAYSAPQAFRLTSTGADALVIGSISLTGADAAEFVQNRVKMQSEHMEEIWRIFGENVRSVTPLLETEIKGTNMLRRTVDLVFEPESRSASMH